MEAGRRNYYYPTNETDSLGVFKKYERSQGVLGCKEDAAVVSLYVLSLSAAEVVSTLSEKSPAESFPWERPCEQVHVTENITASSLNSCALRLWACHFLFPYSWDANSPGGILRPVNPGPTNKQAVVGDLSLCLLLFYGASGKAAERGGEEA